jgi:TolB-like protein
MKGQRGFLKVGAAVALLVTGACTPHKLDDGYRQARIDTYDPMSVFAVAHDTNIVQSSYIAAEQLANQTELNRDAPVLVASLANVNDIQNSSALGRIIADQVGSRLAQLGFAVSEVKLRSTMAINERGEFMLSRDIRALGASQNAQAVVAGTYATGSNAVYISLRLIRLSDSRILGGVDYALPAGPNTQSLIKSASVNSW